MKHLFICMILIFPLIAIAQSPSGTTESASGSTHVMGSGSKSVEGMGVNKDDSKYKNLEGQDRKKLQKQEIGNNPTSTDTIQGKNSKKVK